MKIILPFMLLCGLGATAQTIAAGPGEVTIRWYGDAIARVTKTPQGSKPFGRKSLAVTAPEVDVKTRTSESGDTLWISTKALTAGVCRTDGTVHFRTTKGQQLLSEGGAVSFTPFDDGGRASWSATQSFTLAPQEAIYGFGILQNGKMSQRGENRLLRPGNVEDGIPFFQSSKGYGVYWDNYSPTKIADDGNTLSLTAEVADAADYYFIYGKDADGVVAGVREISGDVPMLPLWAYGFMQSRERYKSQEELLEVLRRYRKDGVPIDCMIQDWQYWGNNYLWNAMEFMNETFPDPQKMLDEVHAAGAKCMISIWSSFGPMTKPYRELDAEGLLFDIETWPQSGISHQWPPRADYPSGVRVYDCYSPKARDIYWKHLRRIGDLGMDGWWMDSTEPDHFHWQESDFTRQTPLGTYRSVLCAYPLMTVGGVYDHHRADLDSVRSMILTRSAFFGQQRTGANTWSGDVVSTWDMLRKQIPAGLNFSLTGNPNFNSDLGGFFAGSYNRSWKGKPAYENPAYHELYVRWMQHGIFYPMMRSHGADTPRELYLYGKPGEQVYDALVGAVKLRYRLLPYIYSTAWQVSRHRDTFMRALAMDFPDDAKAAASNEAYMFGRSLLTTPILRASYTPEIIRVDKDANAGWDSATGRTVIDGLDNVNFSATATHKPYLPAGAKWYYFNDGHLYDGGAETELILPLTEVPFFVKSGSILPLGPDVQYSSEKPWDQLEIRVYPGEDATFTLYEDAGDGYAYERGEYTEIPMTWHEKSRRLVIGERKGAYPGMIGKRTFRVTLPDGKEVRTVDYTGKKVSVKI